MEEIQAKKKRLARIQSERIKKQMENRLRNLEELDESMTIEEKREENFRTQKANAVEVRIDPALYGKDIKIPSTYKPPPGYMQ